MGLIDNNQIEIPCKNCGHVSKKTVRWIKSNDKFACVCGTEITLDSKQFRADIAEVERSLADLNSQFKKLGE